MYNATELERKANREDEKEYLAGVVPSYPNFPKPGVVFRDVLAILKNPTATEYVYDIFLSQIKYKYKPGPTAIVGVDSRGFLFGSTLSATLHLPFVAVRKKGKLPGPVYQQAYQLEYGEEILEIQKNALTKYDRVIIIDDLIATGGTLKAAYDLVRCCGAHVIEAMVVIELEACEARQKLPFGALRLIKSLLPDNLKKKLTVHDFIDKDNYLKYWNNGNDNYKFDFVPETKSEQNGTADIDKKKFYDESQSIEGAVRMLMEACIWRKEFGVRELNEETLPKDSLNSGQIFVRNRDNDGYPLLIMRSFMHKSENTPKLKKVFVYWLERSERESNGKGVSLFFDQQSTGISNFDLDFLMKFIFPVFQLYYPNSLHNIYIYELPWILTSALRLIKSLLPDNLKKKLTVISKSTIHDFIDKDNCLKYWNNGNDNYEFDFVPETKSEQNGTQDIDKKVHFCSSDDNNTQIITNHADNSSINSSINENEDPLKITPINLLKFQLVDEKYRAKITLYNSSNRIVTFKLKTTSPEKFCVSPSVGLINTHCTKEIDIILSDGYFLKHDKFLVTSMFLNDSEELNNYASLWKNCSDSRKIYEHRMVCEPIDIIIKNERIMSTATTKTETVSTSETFQRSVTDQLKAIGRNFDELKDKYENRIKRLEYLQILLITMCVLFVFLWSKSYDPAAAVAAVQSECDSLKTNVFLDGCIHQTGPAQL